MKRASTDLSVTRMTKLDGSGAVKAFCDVAVGNALLLRSFKVVEGKQGLFVSMPRELGKNGFWFDIVVALTQHAKEDLRRVILEAYHDEQ